ncbi:MAG: heavy metal translocating P-type ATPase [Gammaproteobacteria bacterium]|jgi:Cd2+/Zn2+-exporting ATPase|nr:heavy metal translocating P-type ATPase [Gammaproteobacteria bacterium]
MLKTVFSVPELDCPSEEKLIRNSLKRISDIENIECNFLSRELIVTHSLTDTAIIEKAIQALGMAITIKKNDITHDKKQIPLDTHKNWVLIGIAGILALFAEIWSLMVVKEHDAVVAALSLIAIIISGRQTFKKGLLSIRTFTMNINFLMMIAISGAIVIGEWPEAAMVTVLFALAELIERYSFDKARNAIETLMELAPEVASVKNEEGKWQVVSIDKININDVVWVKPGERIPLDGILIKGQTTVNQAPITGESLPIDKNVDDALYAGTLNEYGSIEFRVTANLNQTLLSRIIHAVEEAQTQRAPTQQFVDKFAKYYTPLMVILALIVGLLPPFLLNEPITPWVYKALVLLVIACPCALVISTPITIVSGLASLAKQGILIKGGVYLENGHKLKAIAFDKTGTLTQGKPVVTDFINIEENSSAQRIAASLNTHSEHPIAQSIVTVWKEKSPHENLLEVESFKVIPGKGVKGVINNQLYFIGNHHLAEDNKVCNQKIEMLLNNLEQNGKTTILLTTTDKVVAIFAVADTIRPSSQEAISLLHRLGLKTILITGDNPVTAKAIAKILDIDEVKANQLPEQKLLTIADLIKRYKVVGMVGDGINDAPALAKATIGFAMGDAGTDTALETADVVLVEANLTKLPYFVKKSRKAARILLENITLAIAIKFLFFALALFGLTTLWMAVFADMGVSLIVVINGLRLLRN